ncbi:netrin receptor DCC-like [Catharus ustulatus]|uniref:netrin receptor DCC-like n=1 Tax=Catharus ustulatus TaxID=91951 RepID=UPI00140BB337|nr:netrin receptor DCC-like [Catharus ustulatus]
MMIPLPWICLLLCCSLENSRISASALPPFTSIRFLRAPSPSITAPGSDVVLDCSVHVDGTESTPKILWRKDWEFLDVEKDERRKQIENGSLWIRNVPQRRHRGGHDGVYRCWVGLEGLGAVGSSGASVANPGKD